MFFYLNKCNSQKVHNNVKKRELYGEHLWAKVRENTIIYMGDLNRINNIFVSILLPIFKHLL